jgi:cytochrome c oxidase subunit 1
MVLVLGVSGLLAGLLRASRVAGTAGAESALATGAEYARLFTLHGSSMVFAFALPGIAATLGAFVLPLQLGRENVAFPRLHLASLHLWGLGVLLLLASFAQGGATTGFTLYPPLSVTEGGAVGSFALALVAFVVSALLRAVTFVVTLHEQRAAGLQWGRVTPLAWSLYAYSVVVLVTGPVLIVTLALLLFDRVLGAGFFDAAGGDPVAFQAFFWFAAHGLLYAPILPALGVVSEIVPAFSGKRLFARRSVAVALATFAVLALVGWGEHGIVSGRSPVTVTVFAFIALLGAVPAAQLLGSWLMTLRQGSIRVSSPLVFALGFVSAFVAGGLAGLFLAVQSLGVHLHGTAFTTGHSHYLLGGCLLLGMLAGLHYWWPKITGRVIAERPAIAAALLTTVGVHLSAFPELVAGARGLPRRIAQVPSSLAALEQLALVGGALLAAGVVLVAVNLYRSWRHGQPAADNPWNAASLEWKAASPPPTRNFLVPIAVTRSDS